MKTSFQKEVYPDNAGLLNMVDFHAPMTGTLWAPTDTGVPPQTPGFIAFELKA
jgi:hypothetical protein